MPMTEITRPLESNLCKLTLAGINERSVINEVTVTVTATPAGVEFGAIAVVPIVPAGVVTEATVSRTKRARENHLSIVALLVRARKSSREARDYPTVKR